MLNAHISKTLDDFYTLKASCNSGENLHILCNDSEVMLGLINEHLSRLSSAEQHEQRVLIEKKLMGATKRGQTPWRHVANYFLEKFRSFSCKK